MERDGAESISQGTGGLAQGQVQELFHVHLFWATKDLMHFSTHSTAGSQ